MAYSGYKITEKDRAALAALFPPKFPDFLGHHVTWEFGVDPQVADLPPRVGKLTVVKYVCDDSLECLVVSIDNSELRPDGRVLHLTWSLDRSKGRKPVDSNKLLNAKVDGVTYTSVSPSVNIQAVPQFFD